MTVPLPRQIVPAAHATGAWKVEATVAQENPAEQAKQSVAASAPKFGWYVPIGQATAAADQPP